MNFETKRLSIALVFPVMIVILLWVIKLIEWHFELNLIQYGILPRSVQGLKGIFFSFFIHADFNHLINNSIPLLVLGWALFYFYQDLAIRIAVFSFLLSAFYTWISARTAYHIGASGVVYALFGFVFISGFIRRSKPLVGISFLLAFLYGSLVWGILPWDKSVSWEGHFWGLFVGLILAIYYRNKGPQREVYQWDDDDDDNLEEIGVTESKSIDELEYEYHFIPSKKNEKDSTNEN